MTDTQLGRYHLIRVLGQGSMGIVYEARDPHLDRSVAVKTARTRDLPADQAAVYERRFLTEARSAARLRHPSIVSVFDAGKDGELTYLVMELVDGVNLKHCLNNGVRFTPTGAGRLVWSVLNGLEHAHEQRVIHRDVKPENVLLDRSGLAKLTDFGIAKLLESDTDNGTQLAGLSIGTPRYMSPEQVRGLPVDTRTDLYSVGVLLFELLTASTPFDGANHLAVASQILHDPAPPPSARAPGVSPALDALVAKALAKSPADRFQTAEAFRHALADVLGPHALQPAEAEWGTEPALALVEPDAAPILRWLFAQARVTHPAAPVPPAVSALPDVSVGESDDTVAARPTLPLHPVAALEPVPAASPDAWEGTRVAQLEAPHQPQVDNAMQALAQAMSPAAPGAVPGPSPAPPVAPTPERAKPWRWVVLALLVAGGVWWAVGMGRHAAPQPFEEIIEDSRPRSAASGASAPVAAPADAAPAFPGAASPDTAPAVTDAAATAPQPKPTPAEAARARRDAKAKADAAKAAPPPTDSEQSPAPAASPVPSTAPKAVDAPAPVAPKPAPPREPCVGLSFLEREACLWKQCDADAFRRHPACKRFNPEKSDLPPR